MPINRVKKYVLALQVAAKECKTEKEFRLIAKAFVKYLRKKGEHKIINRIWHEFLLRWKQGPGRELLALSGEPLSKEELKALLRISKKAGILSVREKTEKPIGAGIALLLGSDFFVDSTLHGKIKRLKQWTQAVS